MATPTDTSTNLVINRLTRQIYNELSSEGKIYSDQLYLIDDENFDVFNKRVTNVLPPEDQYDAVNLDYLSTDYIQKDNILSYVDKTRIYDTNLSANYPNGSTYICGDRKMYRKDTSKWNIDVIQGEDVVETVVVEWSSGMGWQFRVNGTFTFGQNFVAAPDILHDTTTYQGTTVEISATSWNYEDTILGKNEVYSCISSINETSELSDIRTSLLKLQEKLGS